MPFFPRLLRVSVVLVLACASSAVMAQNPPPPPQSTASAGTETGSGGAGSSRLAVSPAPAASPDLVSDPSTALNPYTPYSPVATGTRTFREIWAYLMAGEENFLTPGSPVSDLGYFSAGINNSGELSGVPDRKKLKNWPGRVHLVLAEVGNAALSHFVLDPDLPFRKKLQEDLLNALTDYDGLQLDFEAVLTRDKDRYLSFLREIKAGMGSKILSVAIPARTRTIDEAYDYKALAEICDRIIIMAYDEHWSGSKPGSIASLDWCRRVADYAKSIIPAEKLVMGQPFYGRSWTDKSLAKAYKFSSLSKVMNEKNITEPARKEGIPYFEYQETVNIQVYHEDAESLSLRSGLYAGMGVQNIAFWRLGQEDPAIWKLLDLETAGPSPAPPALSPQPGPTPSASPAGPSASPASSASPAPSATPAPQASPGTSASPSPATILP